MQIGVDGPRIHQWIDGLTRGLTSGTDKSPRGAGGKLAAAAEPDCDSADVVGDMAGGGTDGGLGGVC